ncbi:MAG TPA: hypothetical protein VKD72_29640, partial [Gemmataceae bacterium]|nr:hypothetical protein [Gemmataceae bacterium]
PNPCRRLPGSSRLRRTHPPCRHARPARLAVLADALEDAGCSDADLLSHLRGSGPHVRGCWAVDLILGKQ